MLSMALVFTFDIPQIVSSGTSIDSRICVEVEKKNVFFSSLQNSLNCKAENLLKTNISVEKFIECLIE